MDLGSGGRTQRGGCFEEEGVCGRGGLRLVGFKAADVDLCAALLDKEAGASCVECLIEERVREAHLVDGEGELSIFDGKAEAIGFGGM